MRAAGKLIGETKYLGFYEKETQWDQEHVNRVKVRNTISGHWLFLTLLCFD